MARIIDLVAVFRLLSRTTTARSTFATRTLPGYLALMISIRIAANLADAFRVMGAHPAAESGTFILGSFAMFAALGILVLPLLGARSSALLSGHPRLSTVPVLHSLIAGTAASATSIPALLLGTTALAYTAIPGAGSRGLTSFTFLVSGILVSAIVTPALIRRLRIDPRETEVLLLLPLMSLVAMNPHLRFAENKLRLEPLSEMTGQLLTASIRIISRVINPAINQVPGLIPVPACLPEATPVALNLALIPALIISLVLELVLLSILTRIREFLTGRLKLNPFLAVMFSRTRLGVLFICGGAIFYIMNIPLAPGIAKALCLILSLIAAAGLLDALMSTHQDCKRLFGRSPGPGMFSLPATLAAAALAAPYLAALVARLLKG